MHKCILMDYFIEPEISWGVPIFQFKFHIYLRVVNNFQQKKQESLNIVTK